MKPLIVAIALALSFGIHAQNNLEPANFFVRVYDLDGKKIGKGKLISISKTSLYLVRRNKTNEIPVANIGFIRTKRSTGSNVITGAAAGGAFFAIIGVASADADTWLFRHNPGEGFIAGTVIGGTLGAGVGGITALFKNSKVFEINGDIENLNVFLKIISLH